MRFYALYLIILFYFRDMPLLGLKIQTLWQNSRSYRLFGFFIFQLYKLSVHYNMSS